MISFVPGPVEVAVSGKEGIAPRTMQGMIAPGTVYAYHAIPEKTILHKRLSESHLSEEQRQNVRMVSRTSPHSALTTAYTAVTTGSLTPANTATAEALIEYLVEHEGDHKGSLNRLIEHFAQEHGQWYQLPKGE